MLARKIKPENSKGGKRVARKKKNFQNEDEESADDLVEDEEPRDGLAADDCELNQDDSLSHKSFRERAVELMKKTQGEHSHLVPRNLQADDWLIIHRIIRKSKGLKSKFMIRNLSPLLFEPKNVVGWKCKFCHDLISAPVENYLNHLTSHHGAPADDDPLFPCDVCGDYVKRDKYVVHWVPHFMEHECPICRKSFALNCHMKYHYKVVHEEGEQTCFQCGKLLKNDLAMRRHLRLFHSNRTAWKICDICGKRVKSRCLEPHKLTHSQDRPYKCEVCKKCFKTPSTLYQHQKVHATDSKAHKYLCEYCGKRFKHHTSWNLHVVRIHEGEYEHECPVCQKRFHKLFELKKHSVKHSEDRPFPCAVCGKHFKTKTHLKEHLTTHSEEKNHICPLCGKGIRMKANLYKHLKVHRNRGEYVPPLNGNSTNVLFNSFGATGSMASTSVSSSNSQSTNQVEGLAQEKPLLGKLAEGMPECHNDTQLLSGQEIPNGVQISLPVEAAASLMASAESKCDGYDVQLTIPASLLTSDMGLVNDTVVTEPLLVTNQPNTSHLLVVDAGTNAIINIQEAGLKFKEPDAPKYREGIALTTENGTAIIYPSSAIASNQVDLNGAAVQGSCSGSAFMPQSTPDVSAHIPANNIISLITQNENSGSNGGTITHLTILLSQNSLGGITFGQAQVE